MELLMDRLDSIMKDNKGDYGIKIGETAPNFALENQLGKVVELKKILSQKKVVLVFYRGAWCPYCNMQLVAYQEILNEIEARGGTLIAVHSQLPDLGLKLSEELNLGFDILSDRDLMVMENYRLKYSLGDDLKAAFLSLGLDLTQLNASHKWELPVTATYIIDRHGLICHAFIDVDYKRRMEPMDILSILSMI